MAVRLIHDTAFAIASALTEKMDYKLVPAEQAGFHRLVYETCKTAIAQYERQKERDRKRLPSAADHEWTDSDPAPGRGECGGANDRQR